MVEAFSLDDLALLCDDLGVDAENIPGKDHGKSYWTAQIIRYFERQGRLPDLLKRLAEVRPAVQWAYTPGEDEADLDETPATQGDVITARTGDVAGNVAVGKNVVQIGTLVIPAWPLALVGVVAIVLLVALTQASRGVSALRPPPTVPARMGGLFNVAVADFGQQAADGSVRPSEDGQKLAQLLFESLDQEFKSLPTTVAQDFKPQVRFGGLGLVADDTQAEALAKRVGADVVIYANLTPAQNAAALAPRFYVAPLRNEADEIVGRYELGAPIPLRLPLDNREALALNQALNYRQKLLSRFTLGLMYDLLGRPEQALTVFTSTLDELKTRPETEGREVLLYFIGRANLFLQRPSDAEAAFEEALNMAPDYARAYVGLGGVYFQRAQAQPPARRLAEPEAWQTALQHYQTAADRGRTAGDAQVTAKAELGLAYVYRLRGEGYLHLDAPDYPAADQDFEQAARLILGVLPTLQDQYRLLAQAHSVLGIAYEEHAYSRQQQGDTGGTRTLYTQAIAAYGDCLAQAERSPSDAILTGPQGIIPVICQPRQAAVQQALKSLE